MTFIEWKDEFSVGHDGCDEDHKRLISIINRLVELENEEINDNSDYQWIIGELSDYAQIHFLREEQLMEQVHYAKLPEHRLEHANFTEWLSHIKQTYKSQKEFDKEFASNLNVFLRDWLTNHILYSDMQYKGIFSKPSK